MSARRSSVRREDAGRGRDRTGAAPRRWRAGARGPGAPAPGSSRRSTVARRRGRGRMDHLRGPVGAGLERAAEGLVAGEHLVEGALQRGDVERAGDPEGGGDVVEGAARLPLVEEPQALLREGERERRRRAARERAAGASPRRRSGRSGCARRAGRGWAPRRGRGWAARRRRCRGRGRRAGWPAASGRPTGRSRRVRPPSRCAAAAPRAWPATPRCGCGARRTPACRWRRRPGRAAPCDPPCRCW